MINILIGAVALFVFGAIWFTFLFGKTWARLMGFPMEGQDPEWKGMARPLVFNFIVNIVIAWAVYYLYPQILSLTFMDFWKTVFVMWLAFSVPIYVNQVLWERKSWKLFALNAAQSIISYTIIAAIVYYWPL